MIKRIRELDPNLRLKVASVVLAMMAWYMINYFSDPAVRMTVSNVSVQIIHGETIEKEGDVYTVLDDTDVIPTVTIYAKRSIIDKLEAKNVIATADVRQIEDDGSVRISLTTDKYSNSIERISGSISYVQLRVEPQQTKSLPLEVETTGSPADGYVLYDTSAEQNQVIISGPQSYVEKLGRAAAKIIKDSLAPGTVLIGGGLSVLGSQLPVVSEYGIYNGLFDMAGLGRQAFADPSLPNKYTEDRLEEVHWCRCCDKCGELLRSGRQSYCVFI